MEAELISIEGLDHQVRRLAACEAPSEVFRALLEGARVVAPRAAIFLVRRGQIKGWGCVGYHAEAVKRQREFSTEADSGWLGQLARARDSDMVRREDTGADPDFGQQAPAETVALPVRVKDRAIALLLAERMSGEGPWFPCVLDVLVTVAQLRLDLDLARRKLAAAGRPASATAAAAPLVAPAAAESGPPGPPVAVVPESAMPVAVAREPAMPVAAAPESAVPVAVAPVAVAPVEVVTPEAGLDQKQLDAARRYAKLVATDIRLYNEEAVLLGRRHGDLAERLTEYLRRGKETFVKRHGSLGPVGLDILREAYLAVLAGGDAGLLPASVLD
jgi:hypothetical protein